MMLLGFGCVILSAFFFGSLGPAERVAFQYGVTPAGVSLVRAVVGALVAGSYALFRAPRALVPGFADGWKYALSGLFGVVFVYYLSNIAFVTIPVGLTVILFYINPVWTALGAAVLGKEPFTRVRFIAMLAGLAGVWAAVGGFGGASAGDLDMTGVTLAVVSGQVFPSSSSTVVMVPGGKSPSRPSCRCSSGVPSSCWSSPFPGTRSRTCGAFPFPAFWP